MSSSKGIRKELAGNPEEALRLFAHPAQWDTLNVDEVEYVLEETLKCFGATRDNGLVPPLSMLYLRYIRMSQVSRRQELLSRLVRYVSEGRKSQHPLLRCFLTGDTDGQIISGAALDLSMVVPTDTANPLAGPEYVEAHGCGGLRAKLGKPGLDDEGDAAAGLLLLGDMRLLPMLERIWERLTPEGRCRMVRRRGSLATRLCVEFLLRRLEADVDEEHFGELGAFLHDLCRIMRAQPAVGLVDVRRNFGLPKGKEPMEMLGLEEPSQALAWIEPRLEALIERETEPKVLPVVLQAWRRLAAGEPEEEAGDDEGEDESGEEAGSGSGNDYYEGVAVSPELATEFDERIDSLIAEKDTRPWLHFWQNPYNSNRTLRGPELVREVQTTQQFPLLITGIFNPLGPTLTCYAVKRGGDEDWELIRYQLNPFACHAGRLGVMTDGNVTLDPGQPDTSADPGNRALVMKGRRGDSIEAIHAFVLEEVLGASKLQPSFTLCFNTRWADSFHVKSRVAGVLMAAPRARDDLDDLRENKKRMDPWARADLSQLAARLGKPRQEPQPLTIIEAKEMAGILLSGSQQKVEMLNFLAAWEGAIGFNAGLKPVLGTEDLAKILLMWTPDIPNLLAGKEEEKRGVGGEVDKSKQFTGLVWLVHFLGAMEVLLVPAVAIWAGFTLNWMLLGALVLMFFLGAGRTVEMRQGKSETRMWGFWLGAAMLALVTYRIQVSPGAPEMTKASLALHLTLGGWSGLMAFLHLICWDYRRQVEGEIAR